MTIKLGDIDVAQEIVDLHFQLRKTQKLLEILTNKLPFGGSALGSLSSRLNPADIAAADKDALSYVQKKFPNMGIEKKD